VLLFEIYRSVEVKLDVRANFKPLNIHSLFDFVQKTSCLEIANNLLEAIVRFQ